MYDLQISQHEKKLNNIWGIAFNEMTEPYMSEFHKNEVKVVQNRVIESRKTEKKDPDNYLSQLKKIKKLKK